MTQLRERPPARTYGGWHHTRSAGLFGLSFTATLVAFGLAGLVILVLIISRPAGIAIGAVSLAVLIPLAVRINGRTGAQIIAARAAWISGRRARRHLYRSGLASPYTASHRLPGLLAASKLLAVPDGVGGQLGVVAIGSSRHYTVVFTAQSEGVDLVDQDAIDQRVARWGTYLASLSRETDLAQAQVVIETAPDRGDRLAAEIATTTIPGAPQMAKEVLQEVVAAYPAGSATTTYYVALTFKITRGDDEAVALELAKKVPQLREGLEGTGAVGIRTAGPDELIRAVASAYQPGRADDIAAAPSDLLDWANAGPAEHEQTWNTYHHDSGTSRTWNLVEAPRSAVVETVFARLAAADPELLGKRVSLLFRPLSPVEAAGAVERDRRDARFHATQGRGGMPSARAQRAIEAADQAAEEEARGAGVTRFSVLATITVPRGADLDAPARNLVAAAGEARLLLREAAGAQATAFAANLPVGIVLPVHATLPS